MNFLHFLFRSSALIAFIISASFATAETKKPPLPFYPDEALQNIAIEGAHEAVAVARSRFHKILDWSDESHPIVREILATIAQETLERGDALDADASKELAYYSKIFGFYEGEVFRRKLGGEWGYYAPQREIAIRTKPDSDSVWFPMEGMKCRLTKDCSAYRMGSGVF